MGKTTERQAPQRPEEAAMEPNAIETVNTFTPEAEATEAPAQDLDAILEAKLDAILAKAQKSAESIVAEATAKADEILSAAKRVEVANGGSPAPVVDASAAYMEELVSVKLFKDSERYKDDVFVAVNGEGCLIQRGKTVRIKRKFAEALKNSERQDVYAANIEDDLANAFANDENNK